MAKINLGRVRGDQGAKGEQGKIGPEGPIGKTGNKGEGFAFKDLTAGEKLEIKGEVGPKGDKGDDGTDANVDLAYLDRAIGLIDDAETGIDLDTVDYTSKKLVITPNGTPNNIVLSNPAFVLTEAITLPDQVAGIIQTIYYTLDGDELIEYRRVQLQGIWMAWERSKEDRDLLREAQGYVDNKVKTDVPAEAEFTDTIYTAGTNISIVGTTINAIGSDDVVDKVVILKNLISNGNFSTPITKSSTKIGGVYAFRNYSMSMYEGFLAMDGYYRDGADFSYLEFDSVVGNEYLIMTKVFGETKFQSVLSDGAGGLKADADIASRNANSWGELITSVVATGEKTQIATTSKYLTKTTGYFRHYTVIDITATFGTTFVENEEIQNYISQNLDGYVNGQVGASLLDIINSEVIEEHVEIVNNKRVEDMIKDTSKKVKSKQSAATLTFGHITDGHYRHTYRKPDREKSIEHYTAISSATERVAMDFIIHGGDLVDGRLPRVETLQDIEDSVREFTKRSKVPVFFAKGNHDDNTGYASSVTANNFDEVVDGNTWFNSTSRFYKNSIETDNINPMGGYYYNDHDVSKIRTIVLNTTDIPYEKSTTGNYKYYGLTNHSIRQGQLTWLSKTLKELPVGYDVVIIAHVPLVDALRREGDSMLKNQDLVTGILTSFKNKTTYTGSSVGTPSQDVAFDATISTDFTEQVGGEIICQIYGHHHRDNITVIDGTTHITALNSLAEKTSYTPKDGAASPPSRAIDTPREDAWRIITINKASRKISSDGFGASESFEITY